MESSKNNISIYFNVNSANGFLYKKAPNEEGGRIMIILFLLLTRTGKMIFLLSVEQDTI